MSREQQLVDICYQLVLTALDHEYVDHFRKLTQVQRAEWVTDQLRGCGFPTTPCGALWGVLDEH
jgi:hypothetical protein